MNSILQSESRQYQTVDWRTRIGVARSIINHREPSAHVAEMVIATLKGATADELARLDGER